MVRLLQLLATLVATNHINVLFLLSFLLLCPLYLMYAHRLCPWSLAARAFWMHATIAAILGTEPQSVSCLSDRSFPTHLTVTPTNKRAQFKAVGAYFQMLSWLWVICSCLFHCSLLVLVPSLLGVWQVQAPEGLGFLATPSNSKTEEL